MGVNFRLVGPLIVGAGCFVASCRNPTQITLEITTDLHCAPGDGTLKDVTIRVGALGAEVEGASTVTTTARCDPATGRIGSLVVVPSGSRDAQVAIQVVAGVGSVSALDCPATHFVGGCIVARRALPFVEHSSLQLPIALRSSCIDRPCDITDTCVKGQCVPATIVDVSSCEGQVCDEGVLLPGGPDAGTDGDADATAEVDATVADVGADADADADADVIVDSAPDADADDGRVGGPGTWIPIASSTSFGFIGRSVHSAVWTGTRMLVFGGASGSGRRADGASYDPGTNTWTMLPSAGLSARQKHSGVWTGTEMVIWGGDIDIGAGPDEANDGARYDPSKGTWTPLAATALGKRDSAAAVWSTTTNEVLLWGGINGGTNLGDGAAYAPKSDTWRMLPASPLVARYDFGSTWSGKELIIFGGYGCAGAPCTDAAAYDPLTNKWRMLPSTGLSAGRMTPASVTLAGGDVAFFGGGQPSFGLAYGDGLLYQAAADKWVTISTPPPAALATPARTSMLGWFGLGRLYVWGGQTAAHTFPGTGAVYDPIGSGWTAITGTSIAGRDGATVVWTGSEAILYGGSNGADLDDGARFVP